MFDVVSHAFALLIGERIVGVLVALAETGGDAFFDPRLEERVDLGHEGFGADLAFFHGAPLRSASPARVRASARCVILPSPRMTMERPMSKDTATSERLFLEHHAE